VMNRIWLLARLRRQNAAIKKTALPMDWG
jgi:hypothetical protein